MLRKESKYPLETIYKDPITRKEVEGQARILRAGRIIGFVAEGVLVNFRVQFEDNFKTMRQILITPDRMSMPFTTKAEGVIQDKDGRFCPCIFI